MLETSYNATIVKIRAFHGKSLKNSDYKELISKKTVSEVAEYLKTSTYYSECLMNIDTDNIHRGFLESILKKSIFERYIKICKFQQFDKKPFYNYKIVWLEIEQILDIIMHINADMNDDYISRMPEFLLKRASFNLMDAAKTRSFPELLNVIKNTHYYNIIKDMPLSADGKVNFTQCEIMLRTYYLKWMLDAADKQFKGNVKENLKKQVKVQIDLINIINAYRMKFCLNINNVEDIKAYMLPFRGKLSLKKQDELFNAPDEEGFLRELSTTVYGKQFDDIAQCSNDSVEFERQLSKLRFDIAKRALMFSENAAVSIYSVAYLMEIEVSNIVKIIESIRYKRSTDYIESILITG